MVVITAQSISSVNTVTDASRLYGLVDFVRWLVRPPVSRRRRWSKLFRLAPRTTIPDGLSSSGLGESVTTRPRLNFDRKSSFLRATTEGNFVVGLTTTDGQRSESLQPGAARSTMPPMSLHRTGPPTDRPSSSPVFSYPSSGFDSWRDRWQSTSACFVCGPECDELGARSDVGNYDVGTGVRAAEVADALLLWGRLREVQTYWYPIHYTETAYQNKWFVTLKLMLLRWIIYQTQRFHLFIISPDGSQTYRYTKSNIQYTAVRPIRKLKKTEKKW